MVGRRKWIMGFRYFSFFALCLLFFPLTYSWSAKNKRSKNCRSASEILESVTVLAGSQMEKSMDDRAGKWGEFREGAGNHNPNGQDFVLSLEMREAVAIQALTIVHNVCGEAWSTSLSEKYLGKELYPLVIYQDGNRLNDRYDHPISVVYGSGPLRIFIQPENPDFMGGILRMELQNGCEYRVPIGNAAACALEATGSTELTATKASTKSIPSAEAGAKLQEKKTIMFRKPIKSKEAEGSVISATPLSGDTLSVKFYDSISDRDASSTLAFKPIENRAPAGVEKSRESLQEIFNRPRGIRSGSSFAILNCAIEYCP